MIHLAGYLCQDNRATIVCTHVWNGHPVLLYAHDSDGDIQLYCGERSHSMADGLVLGLAEIKDHLHSMREMPAVRAGYCAERVAVGRAWMVRSMKE
jgi:hypothetical protein